MPSPENQSPQLNTLEKLYKKRLSPNEQEEIRHNLYGFLELLMKIDKERKEQKND